MENKLSTFLWQKLKDKLCCNPATAKRIVMINENEFVKIINDNVEEIRKIINEKLD